MLVAAGDGRQPVRCERVGLPVLARLVQLDGAAVRDRDLQVLLRRRELRGRQGLGFRF